MRKFPLALDTVLWKRRGAIAVLVALLLVPLLGCVALCVDLGWMAHTKTELQHAADSAAAAGARQLVDNYVAYSLPGSQNRTELLNSALQSATTYSTRFGGYNKAGGVASLKIPSGDIQFGFLDATGNFQSTTLYAGYPNTVVVKARRDESANGRLPLFFAPVLGKKDAALVESASSTIYSGLISSFDPARISNGTGGSSGGAWSGDGGSSGATSGSGGGVAAGSGAPSADGFASEGGAVGGLLLPVAFDVNDWNRFISNGASPDGTIHVGGSGVPQIKMYPSPKNSPGNFGLLCIGHWTNNTPDFRYWIKYGPTSSDIENLLQSQSLPVSPSSPRPWKGSPGLKSTLVDDFADIIGQPRLLPLFRPASLVPYQAASGNGSNTTYNIVGFVGVTVTSASGNGNNLNVSMQPCSVIDPSAIYDPATIYPLGTEPSQQLKAFTHVSTKFTR